MNLRPAVFLDRDDTLIDDMDYSADPARLRPRPGAAEAVARLNRAGFVVVVATNQSGVARGRFSEADLQRFHDHLLATFRGLGATVDAVYYCPFLDGAEAVVPSYRRASRLRKPSPGMLLQAARELHLDLGASWMIGDALRDVQAGRAAGCRTILLRKSGASETNVPADVGAEADFVADDLRHAADIVCGAAPRTPPA